MNKKYKYNGGTWGKGTPRYVTSDENWKKPVRWAREAAKAGERHRCFFSMGDPLDEEAPPEAQARFWQLIRSTHRLMGAGPRIIDSARGVMPNRVARFGGLDWLLLTKRPSRWHLIPEDVRPLVWLLTSVSDQETADRYIPELLAAEGFAVRGVSLEPMIGPVDLLRPVGVCGDIGWVIKQAAGEERRLVDCHACQGTRYAQTDPYVVWCSGCRGTGIGLDWVIVGGESGPKRRPSEVAWYESIAAQCAAAKVPLYVKQDTAPLPGRQGRLPDALWARKEFPEARR